MKKCLILLLMLLMCLSGCGTLSQSDEISIVLLHGWGTMEEDNQAITIPEQMSYCAFSRNFV